MKHFRKKIIALWFIEVDPVNVGVSLYIPAFLKGCQQLTRLEVKKARLINLHALLWLNTVAAAQMFLLSLFFSLWYHS